MRLEENREPQRSNRSSQDFAAFHTTVRHHHPRSSSGGESSSSSDVGRAEGRLSCMAAENNAGSRRKQRVTCQNGMGRTLWMLSVLGFLTYCTTSIRLPVLDDRQEDAIGEAHNPSRAARLVVDGGTGLRRVGAWPRVLYEQRPPWMPKVQPPRTALIVKRRVGEQIYVPCGVKFKPPAKPQVR